MAIDPISLTLIFFLGAAAGGTAASFWKEIKAWAVRAIGNIIDAIDWTFEVASDAYVYLLKEGARYYTSVEVYLRNAIGGSQTVYRRKEVSPFGMSDEERAKVDGEQQVLAAQYRLNKR
jgi:hypothetical protein